MAQGERNLSESNLSNIARGVGFEPAISEQLFFLSAMFKSRVHGVHFDDNFVV